MRVLIDRHHHALLESYLLLMEDRFGWTVDSPYGMEWFDDEYWNFERAWHGDKVARQYLLGIWGDVEVRDGLVTVPDVRHPNRTHTGVTLEAALDTKYDLVISSLPHNDEGYYRFARRAGAAFGVQVGNNVQQSRWDLASFVLSSSTLDGFGPEWIGKRFTFHGIPAVMYHQEFSLDIFRHEWPPAGRASVASFVNCFPETPTYPRFAMFARAHAAEFDFRVYGAYGTAEDDEFKRGDISWVPDVARAMRDSRVGWHDKWWGDGFGHVIHDWFAIGRPVVGSRRYYEGGISAPLWQEGVTTFDIERPEHEVLDILRRLRDDDEYHRTISENAARRFREVVDFDGEAATIREMLEGAV